MVVEQNTMELQTDLQFVIGPSCEEDFQTIVKLVCEAQAVGSNCCRNIAGDVDARDAIKKFLKQKYYNPALGNGLVSLKQVLEIVEDFDVWADKSVQQTYFIGLMYNTFK